MSDLQSMSVESLRNYAMVVSWGPALDELARRLRVTEAERDEARTEVARLREAVGDTIARWLTRGDFNLVSGIRAALAAQPEPGAAQEGQA